MKRWWQFGLLGGAVLSVATGFKALRAVIGGAAFGAPWGETAAFAAFIFGIGFLCGLIVWAGKGLHRRIGMAGDALVGMVVMLAFFIACMLLFAPEMLGRQFLPAGLFMLGMAVVLGLVGGAWTGRDLRRDTKVPVESTRPPESVAPPVVEEGGVWQRILARWRRQGREVPPPPSADDVRAFEERYAVRLPDAVREYFLTAGGLGQYDPDADLFCFWRLGEVKPVHEELGPNYPDRLEYPGHFVFADYGLWCWAYAVKLTADPTQPDPVRRVTGGAEPGEVVAPSFLEFMTRYANDPDSIL